MDPFMTKTRPRPALRISVSRASRKLCGSGIWLLSSLWLAPGQAQEIPGAQPPPGPARSSGEAVCQKLETVLDRWNLRFPGPGDALALCEPGLADGERLLVALAERCDHIQEQLANCQAAARVGAFAGVAKHSPRQLALEQALAGAEKQLREERARHAITRADLEQARQLGIGLATDLAAERQSWNDLRQQFGDLEARAAQLATEWGVESPKETGPAAD